MNNLSDNEIIKALEWLEETMGVCSSDDEYIYGQIILDLINRQKAEIERLKNKVEELSEVLSDTIRIRYAEAKAEAVKEFLRKQEIELANNTDISAVGYQSVIELNIKILKEMGIE